MRILLLAEDVGAAYSGYTVVSRALAVGMKEAGHEVILVHTRRVRLHVKRGAGRVADAPPYHRSYEIGLPRVGLLYPLHFLLCLAELTWIVRKNKVDWIHLHFHGRDRWFWGVARLWIRQPYGIVWHSLHPPSLGRLRRWYIGGLLKGSSWVASLSRHLADEVRDLWPFAGAKSRVVYPGAEHSLSSVSVKRPDRPIPLDRPFILYVGRLTHEKGTPHLLLAFYDLLRANEIDINLVLCGPLNRPEYANFIRHLGLENRVFCLEARQRPEISELMSRCIFLVLPSRRESFGLAALEAMFHGKPVVASRVGGITEYLDHEQTGLLVSPGSIAELCSAMRRLIDEPTFREALGRRARRKALRFSWSEAVAVYLSLCMNSGLEFRT